MRVAREAVGPEGRVVPQQGPAYTTAPQVADGDRRRLDFVVYGATARGEAPCCEATLVSPLRANGAPVPGAAVRDGVALQHARRKKERRYPELQAAGPHRLAVLPCKLQGLWPVRLRGGRAREVVCPAPRPTRAACAARISAGRMEAPLVGHPGRRATKRSDLRPAWRVRHACYAGR